MSVFAKEIDRLEAENARLRERIVKLEACVKAADALDGAVGWIDYLTESITLEEGREIDEKEREYQVARADVGDVR